MGRKLNLSHLTEEECDQILSVLQKDFQFRHAEKQRLGTIKGDLAKEQQRVEFLKESPTFNQRNCIVCLKPFGLLTRRKKRCSQCDLQVCSGCCQVKSGVKDRILCSLCAKEREYRIASNEWLSIGRGSNPGNTGSSKVVRSLYKRSSFSLSDTEIDSGINQSISSSSSIPRPRPRLDKVFDINLKEDEELPVPTTAKTRTDPRAEDLPSVLNSKPSTPQPPSPRTSVTSEGVQTVEPETKSTGSEVRPRSSLELGETRSKRRKDRETEGLYKEALEGAKRAEEFKFRVKFDKLLADLHLAVEEKSPNGLANSFTSPSYGEVLLTFRGRVKDLLKGFTQRLALAYESFGNTDGSEQVPLRVKHDVSKFIEDLIGETIDLTSDEAVSDLSSLSDESTGEQSSYEDLIAQAVVSKLLENHRKEVSDSLSGKPEKPKPVTSDQFTETTHDASDDVIVQDASVGDFHIRDINTADDPNRENDVDNTQGDVDYLDCIDRQTSSRNQNKTSQSSRDIKSERRFSYESVFSNPDIFSNKSDLVPEVDSEEDIQPGNDVNADEVINVEAEFEELKEFVRKTQTNKRKIEEKIVDDSKLCEIQEEKVEKSVVDREEEREEFHQRYSVLDRIHNSEPALPDFSQFENIDFSSEEIDPDLLSMNLAIIPEETEEELEDEEDEGRWRKNWIFKDKGVLPYENNLSKRQVKVDGDVPLYMMVPRPGDGYVPRVGNRDIDELSDFSEADLLADNSDDEENSFYPNTSSELARISRGYRRPVAGIFSDESDCDARQSPRKPLSSYDRNSLDLEDNLDDLERLSETMSGPLVEPTKHELKLLTDLVPSDSGDPYFLSPPESVSVQEGEPVKFSCRVSGTQPVDVFWYREGEEVEELEDGPEAEMSTSGDRHSVTLYNISRRLAGQYMCIALNDQGKAIQYLVVTVKDNKQDLKKPEFLKQISDVDVIEGQTVKFRVKVKGYPQPRVSWFKDGQYLKGSRSCRIEKFGNRDYILTIDYATMDDDAEYSVLAKNVAGEVKSSAQVIVEPKSEFTSRPQQISNLTSSTSDSDVTSNITSGTPRSGSKVKSSRSEDQKLSNLDRKVNQTQRQVNDEALKMKADGQKLEGGKTERLMTPEVVDMIKTSDEIIESERRNSVPSSKTNTIPSTIIDLRPSQKLTDNVDISDIINPESKVPEQEVDINDLDLPDVLDDFPLIQTKVIQPSTSVLEIDLPEKPVLEIDLPGKPGTESNKSKSEIVSQNERSETENFEEILENEMTVTDDTKTRLVQNNERSSDKNSENTKNVESSLSPTISSLEISKNQSKKWTMTLDPFNRPVDVIHRQNSSDSSVSGIEISVTDLSPVSSLRSSRGANSQQSSPRQSVDSGVYVTHKEKPLPVHMVGSTREDEVPESRTEFNTDGSIELPSVNRLRAMFSSSETANDLGDGNFKREELHANVHSITARSVSKKQLENLRAAQNTSEASGGTSISHSVLSPSSSLLQVPGSTTTASTSPKTSSATLQLSQKEFNSGALHDPKVSTLKLKSPPGKSHSPSSSDTYTNLEPEHDPVLIYPDEANTEIKPDMAETVKVSTKHFRAPLPPNSQDVSSDTFSSSSSSIIAPNKPPRSAQKLLVKRASIDETPKKGPRIKSGCISARAAFWERKMADDADGSEEFPEMVESGN